MECVVTGGAGFIGSHLVDRLLGDGHKVVVIDNFVIGRPENLLSHAKSPRLKIVNADVTDLEAIRPHFDGVDWVFHLAALADIVPSIEAPIPYHLDGEPRRACPRLGFHVCPGVLRVAVR